MIMILHLKYFVSYLMLLCYLFWFKIMDSDNIILRTMYYAALDDCIKGRTNWVSNIKHLFNEYEFAHIFDNPHSVDIKKFTLEFKPKVNDWFKNEWLRSLESPVFEVV